MNALKFYTAHLTILFQDALLHGNNLDYEENCWPHNTAAA
jgi:hypothetical protein